VRSAREILRRRMPWLRPPSRTSSPATRVYRVGAPCARHVPLRCHDLLHERRELPRIPDRRAGTRPGTAFGTGANQFLLRTRRSAWRGESSFTFCRLTRQSDRPAIIVIERRLRRVSGSRHHCGRGDRGDARLAQPPSYLFAPVGTVDPLAWETLDHGGSMYSSSQAPAVSGNTRALCSR